MLILGFPSIILFRSIVIISEYVSFFFSANFAARCLTKAMHSGPTPPFFPRTSGVKFPVLPQSLFVDMLSSIVKFKEYIFSGLISFAHGVHVRDSNIKECRSSAAPETSCFNV